MAKKFYVIKNMIDEYEVLDKPWDEVQAIPRKNVKGFSTEMEALLFASNRGFDDGETEKKEAKPQKKAVRSTKKSVSETLVDLDSLKDDPAKPPYAFVDGSYNSVTQVYGYGGYLCAGGEVYRIQGQGDDPELASMRNVAGEMMGSQAAVKKALELGLSSLCILYDYMGIACWVEGQWAAKKEGTQAYRDYMLAAKKQLDIRFEKVKGHTGVLGNEIADRLAKEAVGIE